MAGSLHSDTTDSNTARNTSQRIDRYRCARSRQERVDIVNSGTVLDTPVVLVGGFVGACRADCSSPEDARSFGISPRAGTGCTGDDSDRCRDGLVCSTSILAAYSPPDRDGLFWNAVFVPVEID